MSGRTGLRRLLPALRIGPQVVAGILLIGLLAAMATKPWMQLTAQKARLEEMAADLSKVETRNSQMEALVERYQDPDYIEQQARDKAGLVKPGEIPYVVMPPSDPKAHRKPAAEEAPEPAAPTEKNVLERFLEFAGLG